MRNKIPEVYKSPYSEIIDLESMETVLSTSADAKIDDGTEVEYLLDF